MVDRAWARMFAQTADRRWTMRCPSPRDPGEAAAQGRALARALAAYPDRDVVCHVPQDLGELAADVIAAAGLRPLAEVVWVSRGPWRGPVPDWPAGLEIHTAAAIGYAPFAAAVPLVQQDTLDLPELMERSSPDQQIAAMIHSEAHRPDWWYLATEGGRPVGMALFDAIDEAMHHYTFLGIAAPDRRRGLGGALFRAAFARLPAAGLLAAVDARNLPSRRMMRAVGFTEAPGEVIWWRPGVVAEPDLPTHEL